MFIAQRVIMSNTKYKLGVNFELSFVQLPSFLVFRVIQTRCNDEATCWTIQKSSLEFRQL
jgi:hypothetical protein